MTPTEDTALKKIRDDTATAILNLQLAHRISSEEMHFLLELLDVVITNRTHPLLPLLHRWKSENIDADTDALIDATLMGLDFGDNEAVQRTCTVLTELLDAQVRD
jgi:hypothetical protein